MDDEVCIYGKINLDHGLRTTDYGIQSGYEKRNCSEPVDSVRVQN